MSRPVNISEKINYGICYGVYAATGPIKGLDRELNQKVHRVVRERLWRLQEAVEGTVEHIWRAKQPR